jgi:hypothetical protein
MSKTEARFPYHDGGGPSPHRFGERRSIRDCWRRSLHARPRRDVLHQAPSNRHLFMSKRVAAAGRKSARIRDQWKRKNASNQSHEEVGGVVD